MASAGYRSRLENFARKARLKLIEAVARQAALYGLTDKETLPVTVTGSVATIGGRSFPAGVAEMQRELAQRIRRHGYARVIDEVAYTWFNRFAAIRYMELHDLLGHGYRVMSDPQRTDGLPEILENARDLSLPGLDAARVDELLMAGGREAELYQLLIVAHCNSLHEQMPFLFEEVHEASELLLPDRLLHTGSVLRDFVEELEEGDWQEIEVIGWLYQYYISEKKDQVMARKSAVPTDDIPAVTQLFTPHWIVRYLVENSLGRLWLLNRPGSRLRDHMPFYIEGEPEADFLKINKPEEIRLCDPAVGSGHMLIYAFDLLVRIYEEEGYVPAEIPVLILRHNLHGLEICPRAAQLASLALVLKAREKSRRFFEPEHLVRPHIIELHDVNFAENELRDYIYALGLGDLFDQPMLKLVNQFEEAKNFGSLIQPCLDEQTIADVRRAIEAKDLSGQLFLRETHLKVLRVLEQAEALTQRYHVVVANPPYLGAGAMNAKLKGFVAENFAEGKADLYGAFILRDLSLLIKDGSLGMITIPNWLFLDSFSDLRAVVLDKSYLSSLVHNGRGVWGGDFGSCGFTIVKLAHSNRKGVFKRLFIKQGEIQSNEEIEANFRNTNGYPNFVACSADFATIPDRIIAYWTSPALRASFRHSRPIGDLIPIKSGMSTTNNERFLRRWHEVSMDKTKLDAASHALATQSGRKWFPFKKGGDFRKWYGNDEYVLNWGNDGEEIKTAVVNNPTDPRTTHWSRRIFGTEYFFLPSITWSKISASYFSVRASGLGAIFSDASNGAFPKSDLDFYASFLNSVLVTAFLKILSPTINSKAGDIAKIPLLDNFPDATKQSTSLLGAECISIARTDWDNFETSWDFRDQPLLRQGLKGATLEAIWRAWEAQSTAAIRRMQELETENNRLFIEAYGLQDELQPEVPEELITLARAEARRDIAAFLSYAIGCMMGRYSLDVPGLVYADSGNEGFDASRYMTFPADEDGILPLTEEEWFEDEAANRFQRFLRTTFGDEHAEENLRFVADALGVRADHPLQAVRRYLATDFFKDHLRTYKKRPIYWLFSSGKERAFQCLVYLHRYNEGTLARMRTQYLIPLQGKIRLRIEQLEGEDGGSSKVLKCESSKVQGGGKRETAGSRRAVRELDTLRKQADELRSYDEQMRHYADMRIKLDLDDGVKVNYGKFGTLLANVKDVTGGKEE